MSEKLPPIEITDEDIKSMEEREKVELSTKFVIDDDGKIRKNSSEDASYIKPDHPIGDRLDQKELFIEYEFTFGRGKAYDITHELRVHADPNLQKIQKEYDEIRHKYLLVVCNPEADPEEIQRVKQEIINYRSIHPELYE